MGVFAFNICFLIKIFAHDNIFRKFPSTSFLIRHNVTTPNECNFYIITAKSGNIEHKMEHVLYTKVLS